MPEPRPHTSSGGESCRETGLCDQAKRETLRKLAALGLLVLADAGALISCTRKAASPLARERKVIVLGLDGLSPHLVTRMMREEKLPSFARLARMGGSRVLGTTVPPESPVAWATFITGLDPGGHGIHDFIHRDPNTYLPYFSIARIEPPRRTLSVGGWRIPVTRGRVEALRRGRAFWDVLVERGVPCEVYRVPTNFPPVECDAKQLAGLGAPDVRGTYGEFTYYTDAPFRVKRDAGGGIVHQVKLTNNHVAVELTGPVNTLREGEPESRVALELYLDRTSRAAKIVIQDQHLVLRQGEWSDWVPVRFEIVPRLSSVAGICRFFLKEVTPNLKLYVTPINVDPVDPSVPIAGPGDFARELADKYGRFYTLGFPQDVKALRRGILDDRQYLQQSDLAAQEDRRIYESALNSFRRGLLCYYFSTSDRTQHMFWRTMDPAHPAHDPRLARNYAGVIEECYRSADRLVGQAMEAMDGDTTLIVLSDHGFAPYYRSFNLNSWLVQQGLLAGLGRWQEGSDIFTNADWGNTFAYGLGFNGLYLNLEGREAYGIVGAEQRDVLLRHLAVELRNLRDPESGDRIITNVYRTDQIYSKVIPDRCPDLVVGYARGFRCSDASVLGGVSERVVEDNTDKWSGDHCIDPALVPGVLFTSRPASAKHPSLADVTATLLAEFGVEVPENIKGRPIW